MRALRMLVALSVLVLSATAGATEPDWSDYAEVLQAHVRPGKTDGLAVNQVDYSALGTSAPFARAVDQVRAFDVRRLDGRAEKLAFYINAYNILTIQLILDHWPLDSIRDIGNFLRGPWDIVMLENPDGRLTLDDIEHGIIRKLGEPRIHFAVNCASVSCPDLRREPYRAEALDRQLDEQTRTFLSQTGKGLSIDGNQARVSRLFDWYEEDFEAAGGVGAFVGRYAKELEGRQVKGYLRYDWRLNGR